MRNHTDLLNLMAHKIMAETYLEVGVQDPRNNFDKIDVARKVGVDPAPFGQRPGRLHVMTSDEYFRTYDEPVTFDLIFIDGLHHADQVRRDFDNSLDRLSRRGMIVLHDTYPKKESYTHVPRDVKGCWTGDVYRFTCRLAEYAGINFVTVDFETGCTIVWRDPGRRAHHVGPVDWLRYRREGSRLLKIIPVKMFNKAM